MQTFLNVLILVSFCQMLSSVLLLSRLNFLKIIIFSFMYTVTLLSGSCMETYLRVINTIIVVITRSNMFIMFHAWKRVGIPFKC